VRAKKREQFGRSISEFQAIQFKLADMAMEIELARNAVHKAAWLKDKGRPFGREASMAKVFASEAAKRAADQAVQIWGGEGFMETSAVARYWRQVKINEIGEGTSEINRQIIARSLLNESAQEAKRGWSPSRMALYALNLFDLADNDLYRRYSRRSVAAVGKHGGRVVALGRLEGLVEGDPSVEPRAVMVLVEWPSREAFDAFLRDPEHEDLHPLREDGTRKLPVVDVRPAGRPAPAFRRREPRDGVGRVGGGSKGGSDSMARDGDAKTGGRE
jgi:uncharacterized protein (DUF1330 family)